MTFRRAGAIPSMGVALAARSPAISVKLVSAKEKSWPLNEFETSSSIASRRA